MNTRPFRLVLPVLLFLPAITASVGGWAVITVEDVPDHVVAGQPVSLTFSVRQHGVTILKRLKPTVEARAGGVETEAAATPANDAGQYTATFTLPRPGDWTITIHSGFGDTRSTLLPWQAVAPGSATPRRPTETERGRRLFVAKGCVACHRHSQAPGSGTFAVGPELTGKRYPVEYLSRFLANPASVWSGRSGTAQMPNLNLKQPEIAALVAFINAEDQALR